MSTKQILLCHFGKGRNALLVSASHVLIMMRCRNNGHRRASKKDGQNSHGKAGAGKSEVADQITPEVLGQSPGSSSDLAQSQEAHRTTSKEAETDISVGTLALPKKKPWSEGTIQARAEEAVKRGASAATLEWLEAESDEGNVEYKLRLKDPSTMRFQQLVHACAPCSCQQKLCCSICQMTLSFQHMHCTQSKQSAEVGVWDRTGDADEVSAV